MSQPATVEQFALRAKAIFIDPALHHRFKAHVQGRARTMQDAAEEAVTEWLDKQEKST